MDKEEKKFNWKRLLLTAIIMIFASLIVGFSTYYVMKQQNNKDKDAATKQTGNLQKQIDELKKIRTETTKSVSNTPTDETSSWKTYNNSDYNFSFKYPTSATVTEEDENYGDARKHIATITDGNDSYIAEVYNIGSYTGPSFVRNYFSGIENGPSEINTISINGNSVTKFFMLGSGIPSHGIVNYFFSKNAIGIDLSHSETGDKATILANSTMQKIANTFSFNN